MVTVWCPETTSNIANSICLQFGPDRPILQTFWKQEISYWAQWGQFCQCGSVTVKSWFIMTTSQYNCSIMNQKCIAIGTISGISVWLSPLCHGGSKHMLSRDRCRNTWYFTSLLTNILALLLIKKLSKFNNFTSCPLGIYGGTEPWPLDPNMWYITYLKKINQASFQIEKNFPDNSLPSSFDVLTLCRFDLSGLWPFGDFTCNRCKDKFKGHYLGNELHFQDHKSKVKVTRLPGSWFNIKMLFYH